MGKQKFKYITKKEREILSPDYPFVQVRNDLIFELARKGLGQRTLSELTGLSRSSINRISKSGINIEIKNTDLSENSRIKLLNKKLDSFYEDIKKIIASFN